MITKTTHNLFHPPQSSPKDKYYNWKVFVVQDDGSVVVQSYAWEWGEWVWVDPCSQAMDKEEARRVWKRLRKEGWEQ
jgi:hypothetical protein